MYSFDPKGLVKLSQEAWRPENRQTITSVCVFVGFSSTTLGVCSW